jgi:hypothetical protein
MFLHVLQKSVLNECSKSLLVFKNCFKSQRILTHEQQAKPKSTKRPKRLLNKNKMLSNKEKRQEPIRQFSGSQVLIDTTV